MAEDRSNAGIAHQLWITEGTVEKHVRSIMSRMRLPETEDDHRRALAVIAFLQARATRGGARESRGWLWPIGRTSARTLAAMSSVRCTSESSRLNQLV